jgi:hypothetical protein
MVELAEGGVAKNSLEFSAEILGFVVGADRLPNV